MSQVRALPLFFAGLFVGASYWWADGASGALATAWKGAGVAMLALWAGLNARGSDGWLIAGVLALGALGDVLLETHGLTVGAIAFLAGHLVAIALYRRNRRQAPSASERSLAAALLIATPLVGWLLTRDAGVALYALGLGAMAASAWLSRFSRYSVGVGAALFVVSDWLIFARGGVLASSALSGLLVWPTYFAAQALIAWGVVTTLAREPA